MPFGEKKGNVQNYKKKKHGENGGINLDTFTKKVVFTPDDSHFLLFTFHT